MAQILNHPRAPEFLNGFQPMPEQGQQWVSIIRGAPQPEPSFQLTTEVLTPNNYQDFHKTAAHVVHDSLGRFEGLLDAAAPKA